MIIYKKGKFYNNSEDRKLNEIVKCIKKNEGEYGMTFKYLFAKIIKKKIDGKTISKPTLVKKLNFLHKNRYVKKIGITKKIYLIQSRRKLKCR